MEKAVIHPLIIRTTSGDDLRYAEEEAEGMSMAELRPLMGGTNKASSDNKAGMSSRSTNLYVKGPTRGSPDIKYIEEDESESELLSLSGIHSRESSTAPGGDCLVDYDVEEINKMLISTPGSTTATISPSCNVPEKKTEPIPKKKDSVVTIVEHDTKGNKVVHKTERSTAHSDSEHTYSIIKDDFSPFRLLTRQPSIKSRSSSPGEGGRRLHSSASAEGRDEEEIFLEALRQVVRKCTNADPRKRPSSLDVLEILGSTSEKS